MAQRMERTSSNSRIDSAGAGSDSDGPDDLSDPACSGDLPGDEKGVRMRDTNGRFVCDNGGEPTRDYRDGISGLRPIRFDELHTEVAERLRNRHLRMIPWNIDEYIIIDGIAYVYDFRDQEMVVRFPGGKNKKLSEIKGQQIQLPTRIRR